MNPRTILVSLAASLVAIAPVRAADPQGLEPPPIQLAGLVFVELGCQAQIVLDQIAIQCPSLPQVAPGHNGALQAMRAELWPSAMAGAVAIRAGRPFDPNPPAVREAAKRYAAAIGIPFSDR